MNLFKTILKKTQFTEGTQSNILLESYLTATPLNSDGTENTYKNYSAQTTAIYRKYNGRDDLGNWQLRAIIDTRTAFISGEGISIICKDDNTAEFLNDVIKKNKLNGSRFFANVKIGEMEGRVLNILKPDKEKKTVKILSQNSKYNGGCDYEIYLKDNRDPHNIDSVILKTKDNQETLKDSFVFTKTGGAPFDYNNPTTKAGLILHNIDSYDRGINAMRKNNHLFGKITPFGSFENQRDVDTFKSLVKSKGWKIGQALAAVNGKLDMVVPGVGAMENIKQELLIHTKAISFITGIPVHWTGWVDAMNNRSTAESLYETINNATIQERCIWQESIYNMLIKAQEIAIDYGIINGTINYDFEVKIPLIPFYKMKERIQALSQAFSDDAISIQDYRNALPGINPHETAQMTKDDIENALTGLKNDRSINNAENNTEDDS